LAKEGSTEGELCLKCPQIAALDDSLATDLAWLQSASEIDRTVHGDHDGLLPPVHTKRFDGPAGTEMPQLKGLGIKPKVEQLEVQLFFIIGESLQMNRRILTSDAFPDSAGGEHRCWRNLTHHRNSHFTHAPHPLAMLGVEAFEVFQKGVIDVKRIGQCALGQPLSATDCLKGTLARLTRFESMICDQQGDMPGQLLAKRVFCAESHAALSCLLNRRWV
jgi:hypothetical protein